MGRGYQPPRFRPNHLLASTCTSYLDALPNIPKLRRFTLIASPSPSLINAMISFLNHWPPHLESLQLDLSWGNKFFEEQVIFCKTPFGVKSFHRAYCAPEENDVEGLTWKTIPAVALLPI